MAKTLQIRRRLPDGSFADPVKPFGGETDEERADRLEAVNAGLMFSAMESSMNFESLKEAQAELLFELLQKGVL